MRRGAVGGLGVIPCRRVSVWWLVVVSVGVVLFAVSAAQGAEPDRNASLAVSGSILDLASDGQRAAILAEDPKTECDRVLIWRPGYPAFQVSAPSRFACSSSLNFTFDERLFDVALSGATAAWVEDHEEGFSSSAISLFTSPVTARSPFVVDSVSPGGTIGDVKGESGLLVFTVNGRLKEIARGSAVSLRGVSDRVFVADVDGGRILTVQRADGRLRLLRGDGAIVRAFPRLAGTGRAAKLDGARLVLPRESSLAVFDVNTGKRASVWPVPAGARLEDAEIGLAVYRTGSSIHIVRLSDGRSAVIAVQSIAARLTSAGLFYATETRVTFIPVRTLLPRIR